jgi:lipopolysaccharide biosynthesis glycosyltransferase
VALTDLDAHLPAGTQVELGHNSPLYYAYYATRANYLRGTKPWETWRTSMLRQLLWRQEADGSWRSVQAEQDLESRFGTALSLMILRMCLNDVPKYLKHEAEGF